MLRCLTSEQVVSYDFLPDTWSVHQLLDDIADASPPYHTLIDAGALITGLTNVQVARPLRSVIQVSSLISSRRPTGRGGPSYLDE